MAAFAESNTSRLVSDEYPLAHSTRETERLIDQADIMQPVTRRLLDKAGISAGMRVLDLGSGADLDIETLEERFRAEAVALGSCLSSPLLVGAWSRVH